MAAHHQQLGGLGLLEKLMGRLVGDDHPPDQHVGVALLPAGQPLAEGLLPHRLQRGPVQPRKLEHPGVAPGVYRYQVHAPERSLLEGDLDRVVRGRRAVHPDHHRRLGGMWNQRVRVVDDRDRALGVMCKPGADGTEQSAGQRAPAAGAHHDHLGAGGKIGQHRDRGSGDHLAGDLYRGALGGLLDGLQGGGEQLGALVLLPLQVARRHRNLREGHDGRGRQDVDKFEGGTAPGGVTGRPVDRDPGRG